MKLNSTLSYALAFFFLAIAISSCTTAKIGSDELQRVKMPSHNTGSPYLQDSLGSPKPTAGDFGFGIKAEGLKGLIWDNKIDSVTLQVRKVLQQPKNILRLDVSIVSQSMKTSRKDASSITDAYYYEENSIKQFAIGLAPGFEKHFRGTRRLDPYIGASLPLVFVGKLKETEIEDDIFDDGGYNKSTRKMTTPGGFGFGLDGIAGLNYFLTDRLALGLEYRLGFSLLNIKGKSKIEYTERTRASASAPEIVETNTNDGDEEGFRTTFFGNKGVAGLSLIFYLGR